MKQQCEYCGSYISDAEENCPNCGAVNPMFNRSAAEAPRTIEQLQKWYTAHNLPDPEQTRFFIGKDYKGPRAFGIYQDGNRFIVYKNKDNGSRAVRYDGPDEAYAVNEIYIKLKETVAQQKSINRSNPVPKRNSRPVSGFVPQNNGKKPFKTSTVIWIIILLLILVGAFKSKTNTRQTDFLPYHGNYYQAWGQYGYSDYDYDSNTYYGNSSHYSDYDYNYGYDSGYNSGSSFWDSIGSSWDNDDDSSWDWDWDSDSDWDSYDSWDSDYSDWDSDW